MTSAPSRLIDSLRPRPQQPADQRHRPLQHPLRLLHARDGRRSCRGTSLLTFEEIERFVRVAATLGIDKIRLTGGEPLVRRDLPRLVEMLAAIPGIKDIGLTTNGILLAPMARALWDAGLRRINVSLDTMDPAQVRAS